MKEKEKPKRWAVVRDDGCILECGEGPHESLYLSQEEAMDDCEAMNSCSPGRWKVRSCKLVFLDQD